MSDKHSVGLTAVEAVSRLAKYGLNSLPEPEHPGPFNIFFQQFKSSFIYVLLIASIVSYALGHTINSIFIFIVLLLNAVIGTIQEYSAGRAAAALEKMVPRRASVYRDGKLVEIDANEIVPGDRVMLVSGDRIPADLVLHKVHDLKVDESMLTGESTAVHKSATAGEDNQENCFAGTIITNGRGEGEVVATGINTKIGQIAKDVITEQRASPPLMLRINTFTLRITYGILILISLIFIIAVVRGDDIATVFFLGVALAVSAIPEGLPAAITVALAIGMRRMARKGVIIRRLVAVESLGSCTYIASDKTGTLTVNEMTIKKIILADASKYSVSGEGMDLHGTVNTETQSGDDKKLRLLCVSGLLANEARLEIKGNEPTGYGDRVDVAFLVLANKYGLDINQLRSSYTELGKIPYESQLAFSASINKVEGETIAFVKGGAERVLSMADDSTPEKKEIFNNIHRESEELAAQGYRVIVLAYRKFDSVPDDLALSMSNLEIIGLIGMIDPLRPDARKAVRQCQDAHIKVAMVTGDHPGTAKAIAKELDIVDDLDKPVTGAQLRAANGDNYSSLVVGSRVFARVEPFQKKEIVKTLIDEGEFVAVTGDGVNDAPALKHAHVGVAMGLRGTDVARESADLILTDDKFSSIVEGVKQGRVVYNNIRKVIFLLISTGAAEITLIILSLMFGMPLPLLPIQLLWLNLVTNGIQDVALAFEPEEGHELKQPPRKPEEPIFNRLMIERVLINAIVMGVLAFIVFYWQTSLGVEIEKARNTTLLLMVLFENVHVLNSRSETVSIFQQYFFGNPILIFGMLGAQLIHIAAMYTPGLNEILQIEPVTISLWIQLLLIALLLIVVSETHKYWYKLNIHHL